MLQQPPQPPPHPHHSASECGRRTHKTPLTRIEFLADTFDRNREWDIVTLQEIVHHDPFPQLTLLGGAIWLPPPEDIPDNTVPHSRSSML